MKRWLPEWKGRWEKIKEKDSLIYMIVEIATGKVYCGEMEQPYSSTSDIVAWSCVYCRQVPKESEGGDRSNV